MIRRAFDECGNGTLLTFAATLARAHEHLRHFQPALILADWRLPDGDSRTFLPEECHSLSIQPTTMFDRARHKNGEYIWLETTARLIFGPENQPTEVQTSSRDITECKQAQLVLQQAHEDPQESYEKTMRAG